MSGRQQRGVASRSGDGSWRRLVSRLRRKLPDTVRGQAEVLGFSSAGVLELGSADSLAIRRAERHGCPPLGPPTPPLARPVDPTGQVDPTG